MSTRGGESRQAVLRVFAVVVAALILASVVLSVLGIAFPPPECGGQASDAHAAAFARTAGTDQLREPDLGVPQETSGSGRAKGGGPSFGATIPVFVHVVTPDGVEGNVPLSKVREQVRVLTRGFGGGYGGADTGFAFDLVGVDRTVNADWYFAGPTTKAEFDMKRALHRGGPETLNLYLTTAGIYLGWAYFPSIWQSPGQAYLDGIVVDWKSLPRIGLYPEFDLGFTAVHEAGHWLNLYHTFQGGCNHWGDYVDDTPPQGTPSFGCPVGKDTCSDPGVDPIHNFMDYSDDPCYTEFTDGQADRMQDAWLEWRA